MATNTVTNIPMRAVFNVPLLQGQVVIVSPTFPLNGIPAANSRFYFKILDFDGNTVYQNPAYDGTPDYADPDLLGTGLTTWLNPLIDIPTNSNTSSTLGIVTGQYTVTVLQRDNTQVVTDLFTQSFTKSYDYVRPVQSVNVDIDIFTPLLTLTDETNYTVTDPQSGSPLSPTNFSWNWKLFYPSVLELSPLTSTAIGLQTDVFYEGPHEWSLSAGTAVQGLRYDYTTSDATCVFRVIDYIVSTGDFKVDASSLCDLYCCLKAVESRYYSVFQGNETASVVADAMNTFQTCMAYNALINQAVKCGSYDDVEGYIEKIRFIAKCADDCGCGEDGFPRQITGIGSPNITQRIEEVADGATNVFPTSTADKNKLKNKSFVNGNFIVFDEDSMIPSEIGSGSGLSFSTTTGECTLNYTPTAGNVLTFQIIK